MARNESTMTVTVVSVVVSCVYTSRSFMLNALFSAYSTPCNRAASLANPAAVAILESRSGSETVSPSTKRKR